MSKRILFAAIAVALLFTGLLYLFLQAQSVTPIASVTPISPATPTPSPSAVEAPHRVTLEGEYVCLPHKDTSGPQTEECAFGMKTTDGTYYAVDMMLLETIHEPLNTGTRFRANGLFTPVEYLSSNHWQIYPIKGIFSITDSLEIL